MEDLWPFNEEPVARAIYGSRAPVISAVGHETDFTIADLVADVRAPTPSAAAEMAVPDSAELVAGLIAARQSLVAGASRRLAEKSDSLRLLDSRLARSLPDLDTLRMRIDDLLQKGATSLTHNLEVLRERLAGLTLRLESLSPRDTLRRGYAVVQRQADGVVVSDAAQVGAGDKVGVTLGRGAFEAGVTSVAVTQEEAKPAKRSG